MGFGVWGLGFGVWGLGFGVWGLRSGVWDLGFEVGVWGLGFGVWDLGFGAWGLGSGVWGLGCGVWALGSGVSTGRGLKTFRTRVFSRCTPIPDCNRQRGSRFGNTTPCNVTPVILHGVVSGKRCLQQVRCCLQRRRRCLQLVCECGHHFHGGRGLVSDLISKHL